MTYLRQEYREAMYREIRRRLALKDDYNWSLYVGWFLPHVVAWIPNVEAREAIVICHAFYIGGIELGRMMAQSQSDTSKINMGLAPDSVRCCLGQDQSPGYKITKKARYGAGCLAYDKYIPQVRAWVGFHFLTWG